MYILLKISPVRPQHTTQVYLTKFRLPSTWEPEPPNVDPAIETFYRAVMNEIKDFVPRCPCVQNLSKEEKEILHQLKTNKAIELRTVDKGSAVVIMDTTDYIKEAERQLTQTSMSELVKISLPNILKKIEKSSTKCGTMRK